MMRGGRSVLVVLSLMLASAGAMRLGAGVGTAMAADDPVVEPETPLDCPAPPLAVAQALSEREARLKARETAAEARFAALDLADAAIRTRLDEMKEAEDALSRLVTVSDGAAERDLDRLTAVYEAMKPAEAARLFAAMAPDFAAGFLARMKPQSAAAVLAGMQPDAAYAVTALIAGKNARAPTE